MMRHMLLGLTLTASLALAAGCGLGSDEPAGPQPEPEIPEPEPTDPGKADRPARPVLDLTSTPADTCATVIGIRGTAQPGSSVFAFGGASSISTDAAPGTGAFCLPVPLVPGRANQIEIRAQDPATGQSEPTSVTVVQKTCSGSGNEFPSPTTTQPTSQNVALGATVKGKDNPVEGNPGLLTDGKTTFARWQQDLAWYNPANWTAYGGWVTIKLDRLHEVQKIVLRWRDKDGSGTAYGSEFKVLISQLSDPGDPSTTNGYWETVASITDGKGGVNTFDLGSKKPMIQYVAIWLDHDGLSWVHEGRGEEEFAISEVEVWDVPKSVTPPPATSMAACQ